MKHKTSSKWLLLLCFIKLNASQQKATPTDSSLASSKLQAPISHNLSDDTSDDNDDEDSNDGDDENEQEAYNSTARKIDLIRKINNYEAQLELPKSALLPLAKTLLNNYPVKIKEDFEKFVNLAGNARLQLKSAEKTLDAASERQGSGAAQKLVEEASKISSKLLAVSVGRDELRKDLLDLAQNLSFEESYNATNKLLTFPSKYKLLKLINPVILNSLSLCLNLTPINYTFDTTNMFATTFPALANNPQWINLLRNTVRDNENKTSAQDLFWYAAIPILAAQHSSEEHAHNLTNPKQLLFWAATICQYLKPLIALTPRLAELLFIKKSPRDETIEAFAGLFGSGLAFANILYKAQKKYLHTQNSYPFSEQCIKGIEQKSKAWQKKLKEKLIEELPPQNLSFNNSSINLSPELITCLKSSIDRQKQQINSIS